MKIMFWCKSRNSRPEYAVYLTVNDDLSAFIAPFLSYVICM